MLKKLFRYDFSAIGRYMVPTSIAVIGTSVVGMIFMRVMMQYRDLNPILMMLSVFTVIVSVLAIAAYMLLSVIWIVRRYYTNFFSDEGYLTFTLPVRVSALLNAKVLSGIVWSLISALITFLCFGMVFVIGTAEEGIINRELVFAFRELVSALVSSGETVLLTLEAIVLSFVSLIQSIMLIFGAVTVGSILAKKHKILAAIGVFYIANFIQGIISNIFTSLFLFTNELYFWQVHGYLILMIVLYVAFATAYYLLNRYFLNRKLNLQ